MTYSIVFDSEFLLKYCEYFYLTLNPTNSFFIIRFIICTCTEECVLAADVPNPMGLYYT